MGSVRSGPGAGDRPSGLDSPDAHGSSRLDMERLASFTADGASVMGTRAALSAGGNDVASMLSAAAARPLLVEHCAAHRLQLSASQAPACSLIARSALRGLSQGYLRGRGLRACVA